MTTVSPATATATATATTPATPASATGTTRGTGTGAGTSTGTGTTGQAAALVSRNTLTADFTTFLQLLTTQLKNQDPLNPTESTEFVAQLATFSSVEQQVASNDKLNAILDALTGGSGAGLAEWIGRDVRAHAAVAYDDAPLTVHADPVEAASLAVLVIEDAGGTEKGRVTIDAKATEIPWDGQGTTGTLPAGTYRFRIESYKDGNLLATRPAEVFAPVVEVRRDGDAVTLVLQDGTKVNADDVKAVRNSAPAS